LTDLRAARDDLVVSRRQLPALVGLLLLAACGRSPSDVVEDMGELAEKRKLVQFRKLFTSDAVDLLHKRWREDGLTPAEGWLDLMVGYLGKDREPPEVVGEELKSEEVAVVKVAKEFEKQNKRIVQELTLQKQDDEWRLTIGEMVYVEEDLKTGEKEEKKEPPLADEEDDDDWGLEDPGKKKKKKARENLEDFDLDKL